MERAPDPIMSYVAWFKWGHPDLNRESRFRKPVLYPFKRWPLSGANIAIVP